jgi:hypothetical protein
LLADDKSFVPLSSATDELKRIAYEKQFHIDRAKLNKTMKKYHKSEIDEAHRITHTGIAEEDNDLISRRLFSTELGKRLEDEMRAYKK